MQPTDKSGKTTRWLWLAGLAILIAGVGVGGWLAQRGMLFSAPKSQRAAANPLPAASSLPEAAPSKPPEFEVTVPVDSLDRMHLQFAKVSSGTMSSEIRVPGTVQANALGVDRYEFRLRCR